MIVSILFLLALAAGGDAYALARRVEQKFEDRAASLGGWALSYPNNCPANSSTICSSSSGVNQQCCPQGTTCFDGDLSYCCPSSKDCNSYVITFGACVDLTANMYEDGSLYFCCAQGFTGVIPPAGFAFCVSDSVSVATSLLATMVSQYGGTSVTPFGGFATAAVTGSPANTGAGGVTATAGSNPSPTSTTTSPTATSTSSSSVIPGLTNAEFAVIIVAGLVVFGIAISIWRCCKAKARNVIDNRDRSHRAGPSMMPAYIPTNVQIYEPAPTRPYGHDAYDPVLERHTAISPMSPRLRSPSPAYPMTPSPAYSAVDQQEMPDPIEVHGVGSTAGRVEMA